MREIEREREREDGGWVMGYWRGERRQRGDRDNHRNIAERERERESERLKAKEIGVEYKTRLVLT